jgi:hypothetical protein
MEELAGGSQWVKVVRVQRVRVYHDATWFPQCPSDSGDDVGDTEDSDDDSGGSEEDSDSGDDSGNAEGSDEGNNSKSSSDDTGSDSEAGSDD